MSKRDDFINEPQLYFTLLYFTLLHPTSQTNESDTNDLSGKRHRRSRMFCTITWDSIIRN